MVHEIFVCIDSIILCALTSSALFRISLGMGFVLSPLVLESEAAYGSEPAATVHTSQSNLKRGARFICFLSPCLVATILSTREISLLYLPALEKLSQNMRRWKRSSYNRLEQFTLIDVERSYNDIMCSREKCRVFFTTIFSSYNRPRLRTVFSFLFPANPSFSGEHSWRTTARGEW